ncbi:tetratricopeptide repeat protein [Microtetraspora sp. NBRC 13810]|uniref:tetratricopeptide repeat protein n=1 Tax=Microtetraspora sp. NBRC 13810 TaxID=3030990 RepID=UPI002556878E|nr:tetratricopeptide repeat protein [Microtetraspora sp. NBRC 13810]
MSGSLIGGPNIQIGHAAGDVLIALDRPGYRLEMLGDAPPVRLPRSRRGPSYLLDVQRQVVPYRSRPAEEEALTAWRDVPDEPVSVILLHGPGGQGKTRLAAHFASRSHAAGWAVSQAVEKTPRLHNGSGALELADRQPLLVVVDYAERWDSSILTQMIDGLAWDLPGRTVRLLLLARPGEDLWQSLCAQLDRSGADLADPIALGDFTPATDRPQAYLQAAAAFAAHLEHNGPVPGPPADLDHPDYASALTLHMAALAAIYAAQEEAPAPNRPGLSDYLLNHEMRYWQATTPAFTSPAVIERMVFLATVFGPLEDTAQARSLLHRTHLVDGPAQAGLLLDTHRRLYPPATPARPGHAPSERLSHNGCLAGGGILLPLRPDRFGEDFIAHHLRYHAVEAAQTLTTLTAVTAGSFNDGQMEADRLSRMSMRRCLIVLTATAARHPQARTLLLELLDQRPELARYATADLVGFIIDHAEHSLAMRFHDALPDYDTDLLQAASNLALHLLHTLPADASPALRAPRLSALGIRLSYVGDIRGALEPSREAVELYRRLAEVEPEAYLPGLANSLNNLGTRLSAVGDIRRALKASWEAVELYRQLDQANPAAHLPRFTLSLNNLATQLWEVGDKRRAVELIREVVESNRHLAEADPTAYLPDLAMSLNNLGTLSSGVGDIRRALGSVRESVELYRRLAEVEPEVHLRGLAMSLNNLGNCLSGVGDIRGAVEPVQEAVEIRRRLAEAEPKAYLADLAKSLTTLGARLWEAGDKHEAVEPAREAVELHRRLAEVEPAANLPGLAMSLSNLGGCLSGVGDKQGAVRSVREAVEVYRQLAGAEPAAYLPNLAISLSNLGALLSGVGDKRRAVELAREAVELHRQLAEAEPEAYLPDLASSLATLGTFLSEVGDKRGAVELAREAVELHRQLAEVEPEAYLPDLALSLWTYARVCNESETDLPAGLSAAEEAISHYRWLAGKLPGVFGGFLNAAQSTAAEIRARLTPVIRRDGIGNLLRNAPCPCGSGKKYKRCHGTTGGATLAPDSGV